MTSDTDADVGDVEMQSWTERRSSAAYCLQLLQVSDERDENAGGGDGVSGDAEASCCCPTGAYCPCLQGSEEAQWSRTPPSSRARQTWSNHVARRRGRARVAGEAPRAVGGMCRTSVEALQRQQSLLGGGVVTYPDAGNASRSPLASEPSACRMPACNHCQL
jgi:hypothetical protein